MRIKNQLLSSRRRWLNKPIYAKEAQSWLIDKGSLTARLQQHYCQFSVNLVSSQYAKPMQDEVFLLQQASYQTALIREVFLMGACYPVVFAHSVLPRYALRGPWHGLARLGHQSLGATLFANPKVKRTPLTYQKLYQHHPMYQLVAQHLRIQPSHLWARRSVFSLASAAMMVTEVFLPPLFNLK